MKWSNKHVIAPTYFVGYLNGLFLILHLSVKARDHVHLGLSRDPLTLNLVSHGMDGMTVWANEDHSNTGLEDGTRDEPQ